MRGPHPPLSLFLLLLLSPEARGRLLLFPLVLVVATQVASVHLVCACVGGGGGGGTMPPPLLAAPATPFPHMCVQPAHPTSSPAPRAAASSPGTQSCHILPAPGRSPCGTRLAPAPRAAPARTAAPPRTPARRAAAAWVGGWVRWRGGGVWARGTHEHVLRCVVQGTPAPQHAPHPVKVGADGAVVQHRAVEVLDAVLWSASGWVGGWVGEWVGGWGVCGRACGQRGATQGSSTPRASPGPPTPPPLHTHLRPRACSTQRSRTHRASSSAYLAP